MNWLDYCCFLLKVNDWLERLVDEQGEDLYRLKGVISVNESTGRFVFQVSHYYLSAHLLQCDLVLLDLQVLILLVCFVIFCQHRKNVFPHANFNVIIGCALNARRMPGKALGT